MPAPLLLASTSVYRRELLTRLGLAFDTARPETDETPQPGETPLALAQRLAVAKAAA
ncbi:MAG: Maf family protein, partial [Lysobacter sp.]